MQVSTADRGYIDQLVGLARDISELADRISADACEDAGTEEQHVRHLLIESNTMAVLAQRALTCAVRHSRESGYSWQFIGAALGISRQTAYARFSERKNPARAKFHW